jgi:hypothetical protein
MDSPDDKPGRGAKAGLLLIAILTALIAAGAYWFWSKNPTTPPDASATGSPPAIPAS